MIGTMAGFAIALLVPATAAGQAPRESAFPVSTPATPATPTVAGFAKRRAPPPPTRAANSRQKAQAAESDFFVPSTSENNNESTPTAKSAPTVVPASPRAPTPAARKMRQSAEAADADFAASTPGIESAPPTPARPGKGSKPPAAKSRAKADDNADFSAVPSSSAADFQGTGARPRTLTKGTEVAVTISEHLGSKLSQVGQRFAISLARPITLADGFVVPAGTSGEGEVVQAAKAGAKAGQLVLAASFLSCGAATIPLGQFKFDAVVDTSRQPAVGLGLALFASAAVKSRDIDVPIGTVGTARVAADTQLPAGASGRCR